MLRISPQANQLVLPSPQPLSMLLSGLGGSSSRSGSQGSGTDKNLKMNPGDAATYSMAVNNLEAQYKSKLNKVFNDAMQSNEGWQAYATKESTINELQQYNQEYQNQRLLLDAEKDYLEGNVARLNNLETYLKQKQITDNDFIWGEDDEGNVQIGIDTPAGKIMTAGALKNYNATKPYQLGFMEYTAPAFEELDDLLKRKLDEAAENSAYTEVTQTQGDKAIRQRNYVSNKPQLEMGWQSFMNALPGDQALTRAYNIRKYIYDKQLEGLSDEDREKAPSFQEYMMAPEINKRIPLKDQLAISEATGETASNKDQYPDIPTNFFMNVLYGMDRMLSTDPNSVMFDATERKNIAQYIPAFKDNDVVKPYLTEFDTALSEVMSGEAITSDNEDLTEILASGLKESLPKLRFDPRTERGKDELDMYMQEFRNEYLYTVLTDAQLKEVANEIYEIPEVREREEEEGYGADYGVGKALQRTGETVLESLYLKPKSPTKDEAKKKSDLYKLVNDPNLTNFEFKNIIRYGTVTTAYDFENEEFEKSSLYMKTPTDRVLFLGNYIDPTELYDPEEGVEPVFYETGGKIYADMPWTLEGGTETKGNPGARVRMMVLDTKENRKKIKFTLPDSKNDMITRTLKETDDERFPDMNVQSITLTKEFLSRNPDLMSRGYKAGDDVLVLGVDTRYNQIVTDALQEISPSQRTFGLLPEIEDYLKRMGINIVMHQGFDYAPK